MAGIVNDIREMGIVSPDLKTKEWGKTNGFAPKEGWLWEKRL